MIRDLLKHNQYLYCPENPEKCEDHRKVGGDFGRKQEMYGADERPE